jgi:uncharacterized protein (UPF0332 family)
MNSYTKNEIIAYRLEKADVTIREAKALAQLEFWNTVANRLYYACFYVVLGLFTKENHIAKTHDGVRRVLHLHFVQTNRISEELAWFYGDLFNKRQESDYKVMKIFTRDDIEHLIPETEAFIQTIKQIIDNQ